MQDRRSGAFASTSILTTAQPPKTLYQTMLVLTLLCVAATGCSESSPSSQTATRARARVDDGQTPSRKEPADKPLDVEHHSALAEGRGVNDRPGATTARHSRQAPAATASSAESPGAAQPVFRPPDTRPAHDDALLERSGLFKYESARLKLYTDIDPKIARTLPAYVDQLYKALVEYFGPLPPNRARSEYQITGYIMADSDRFRSTGLLKVELPKFAHGQHRGAEFWMYEQEHDYYRRHLLIHEAVHCFMTTMPDTRAPLWYIEGMAELFGTHRIDSDGKVHFRVMPGDREDFVGFGRIGLINREVAKGQLKLLDDVTLLEAEDFAKTESYAWSWALCKFLDSHPRYRSRFRTLGQRTTGTQFLMAVRDAFENDVAHLRTQWALFAAGLVYGYDVERAVIEFRHGQPLPRDSAPARFTVEAAKNWQSSGVTLERGRTYELTADGRFSVAQEPKPWISEPQGVSITYANGRPLGMLMAAIRSRVGDDDTSPESMLNVIPVGRHVRFTAVTTGTLYLRLNDELNSLADNAGEVTVEIRDVLTVGNANDEPIHD